MRGATSVSCSSCR
ncbi:TPA: hypothetical protein DCL30_02690 [Candidatus Peribacteria bacterium]|nr:hypothetical protein [Candidatus Peribacteria bacterium]HAS34013.1 hypothetical protein [Candidatus Peribacteria bacterium]